MENPRIHTCTMMPSAARLAFWKPKLWQPGQLLTFNFLGDRYECPESHLDKIESIAMRWTQYANIELTRVADKSKATIRIGFDPGSGSWSYIGKDCLTISRLKPTMNYGWFDDKTTSEEMTRVVLHEFGHALGAIHEHQSPSGEVPWDREAVYAYYQKACGWDKKLVDINIFETYRRNMMLATEIDKRSIMMYPIPQELTIGDYEVGWNNDLSDGDKAWARTAYPPL